MAGSIFLSLAFAMAFTSLLSYGLATFKGGARYYRIGRFGFHGAVISFMFAAAALMYYILGHQFQYNYIYEHSSNNLPMLLQIASFYAGQQGSFMLWTLMTGLIGVFVLGYAQRTGYEKEVMTSYMLVMTFLLLILVIRSPFTTIWGAHPEQNIPANFIPPNGRGLNPQLENLWITIHPPILFTGFAAMTVPFAFAIAGLLKRDYQRWVTIALPWALFGSMVLGFGIMLGGWWAYETLGWGGFWAWDPVENSSLIPWLACVSLVHTMLVQKRTGSIPARGRGETRVGGLVKTNFVLAVTAFGLVLYSTYLTRSGVLGDTSVHSFVTADNIYYALLVIFLLLFVGIGIFLIIKRWRDLKLATLSIPILSRENALVLGSATLLASALVVVLGTSRPIIAPLFNMPKVSVQADFYNAIHLPLSIILLLLNGLSMRLKWRTTEPGQFMRQLWPPIAISLAGAIGLLVLGVTDPIYLFLGFAAVLALVVNVHTGYRVLRGNRRFIGAYVSHAGIALLMLGIVFTARYSVLQHIRLVEGEPKQLFGYSLTYKGAVRTDANRTDRETYQHIVQMEKGGSITEVRPVVFWSDYNNREGAFLEPGILYGPTRDIYLSPKAVDQEGGDPMATLRKGESAAIPFDKSFVVRFEKFDMSRAQAEGLQGAVVEVKTHDSSTYLTSYRRISDGKSVPVQIPGSDITVSMVGLNADKSNLANSQAILMFSSPSHPSPPAKAALTLDVSIKPYISLVWIGVIIMVGGFFFSIIRRRKELALYIPEPEEAATTPAGQKPVRPDPLTAGAGPGH
ncbi:MAG TPA: cytochrome c-type biogenesis CcmF C-terminal domain-containing protein [Candidatus Kapabacteria bacterium]|nr:cytochrome c-type biogenesis CcmF C-terminal domain-containing protein [Candidatus Kapabacteria bacterium]